MQRQTAVTKAGFLSTKRSCFLWHVGSSLFLIPVIGSMPRAMEPITGIGKRLVGRLIVHVTTRREEGAAGTRHGVGAVASSAALPPAAVGILTEGLSRLDNLNMW